MRKVAVVIVALLITACGKNRQSSIPWPAVITNFERFSEAQKEQLLTAVNDLNTQAGKTVITTSEGTGFPISLKLVEPTEDTKTRAGYAILEDDKCNIEISTIVFEPGRADVIKPVLWHEIGHCVGLTHDPQQGEIMFRITSGFTTYTKEAVQRFLYTMLTSAQLL